MIDENFREGLYIFGSLILASGIIGFLIGFAVGHLV